MIVATPQSRVSGGSSAGTLERVEKGDREHGLQVQFHWFNHLPKLWATVHISPTKIQGFVSSDMKA